MALTGIGFKKKRQEKLMAQRKMEKMLKQEGLSKNRKGKAKA